MPDTADYDSTGDRMSETRSMPKIPEGVFTPEQIEKINGGLLGCSSDEITNILANLQQNYDTLVGFTSYVIENVGYGLGLNPPPQ